MASQTVTATRSLGTLRTGVVLAVLITLIDVGGMLALGLPNAPLAVIMITSVLAVATIIGAIWAWRGRTWGVWVVAVSRGLSALSLVPIFFVPEAPQEAIPMSIVVAVLSVAAIILLFIRPAKRS